MDIIKIELIESTTAKHLRAKTNNAINFIIRTIETDPVPYLENGYWDLSRYFNCYNSNYLLDGTTEEEAKICIRWINSWLYHYQWKLDENHHVRPI